MGQNLNLPYVEMKLNHLYIYLADSGDIVDRSEIIQALDDEGTNTSARVENINEYVSPEDGMNHITFDLKIVKSTLNGPICRFNKIVILIVMFLSLATAIFILFFMYVLNGQG